VSRNHEGYEQAMKDVFSILDSYRSRASDRGSWAEVTRMDTLKVIRIALETLRTNNIVRSRIDKDNRCEETIFYGFESRSYRCTKKRGHDDDHVAEVRWSSGIFGTILDEKP